MSNKSNFNNFRKGCTIFSTSSTLNGLPIYLRSVWLYWNAVIELIILSIANRNYKINLCRLITFYNPNEDMGKGRVRGKLNLALNPIQYSSISMSLLNNFLPLFDILTYCVLFWLLSWNFIGLLDAFCKDSPCMIVAVDTQVGVAWLIDFYKRVW